MVAEKTAAMNIRIRPNVKEAARILAKRENRSIANLMETLIIQQCERVGITIPEQQELPIGDQRE